MTVKTAAPKRTQKHRTTSYLPWNTARLLIAELENEGQYNTALMIAAGIYFGLRISDLLSLTWGKVRSESFSVNEGKTGKLRHLDVHPNFAAIRDRYASAFPLARLPKDSEYLFTPQVSHRHGKPISVTAANKRFATALSRHKIKTANPSTHTLRKTFARRIWETNGKSEAALVLLSDILNHQSISVTRRYLGITGEEISAAYLSL